MSKLDVNGNLKEAFVAKENDLCTQNHEFKLAENSTLVCDPLSKDENSKDKAFVEEYCDFDGEEAVSM